MGKSINAEIIGKFAETNSFFTMDSYPSNNHFETKIETFDPCIIQVTGQQREIMENPNDDTQTNAVNLDSTEDHENLNDVSTIQEDPEQQQQHRNSQIASVQSNTTGSLTPVRLPAILDGEFFSVIRVEDTNVTVRCLQCQKLLNGNLKSTGNFLSHIKRVHPFMIEKIKCKSNQRKPAVAYIDVSTEKSMEIVRTKRGYRKCYKADDMQTASEEVVDQPPNWPESPVMRRRKYEGESFESQDIGKLSQNNSFVVEDEFDAIGRNVAAKLRNMRLDQRIIAEKLLNDVLFEAQLGTLHRDSNLHV